jgi:cytochrome c peroxidase
VAVYTAASSTSAGAPTWRWNLPRDFPQPRVPKSNPMSAAKVAVGRRLFYDTRLSGNGTQACASCHRQELAFTDGRAQLGALEIFLVPIAPDRYEAVFS